MRRDFRKKDERQREVEHDPWRLFFSSLSFWAYASGFSRGHLKEGAKTMLNGFDTSLWPASILGFDITLNPLLLYILQRFNSPLTRRLCKNIQVGQTYNSLA
jgi:hypothetical protein